MTDRELLEFAAKAAGIKLTGYDQAAWLNISSYGWNSLTDDGDAFRLAVRLSQIMGFWRFLRAWLRAMKIEVGDPADPCAATRRAITRAAAEIGRTMK
jgi:hypothetical protein